jgi:HEAT repeat protein
VRFIGYAELRDTGSRGILQKGGTMDSEKIQILFAQSLLGDYESDDAWTAVSALRMDGNREIFESAAAWCCSDDSLKRARAPDILCQLREAQVPDIQNSPEWMFADESYELITNMLENEQNPLVLHSAITALGHLRNPKAVPIILRYQDHPDDDIRFAVSFALGCVPNNPHSIVGLTKLTMDSCSDVRDWAVFGLGVQGDSDSPEIREALCRCLNDTDEDVREEAAVGLGKRHDQRLLPRLKAMLDSPEIPTRVAEAATEMLELVKSPPEWTAADYKAALVAKFNLNE